MSSSPAMLPEELLVEIMARVPYRSLCRFRCVSPSWRALCSDPSLLKRSPQTLSGFFCYSLPDPWIYYRDTRFLNFPGGSSGCRPLIDPSFPFLHAGGYTDGFVVADCCGGLLLVCEWSKLRQPRYPLDRDYLVCNPATEKWTVLPRIEELDPENVIRLCFDPAQPHCFRVFVFVQDHENDCRLTGVKIYSSETRMWTSEQIGWGKRTSVIDCDDTASVFLNGTLHLIDYDSRIVTVDMDVWVLEDFARGRWTLKHTANEPCSGATP
ncbi:F-box protein At5g07610-like [Aegilops tauschii subsp. strangulata]|uniref:F-box protein At5g07610-like n=1 Tax=Aegilops tauschii subsp. strangulata TaxID=200361 RepID=UPI00098B3179|nr:F-box protein At3g49450-like [Aegilops tauschii subsp. strangulata]